MNWFTNRFSKPAGSILFSSHPQFSRLAIITCFWASHTEHHKYTLHPPDDLEVVLPVKLTLKGFRRAAIVNPWLVYYASKTLWRQARGKWKREWEHSLFDDNPKLARKMRNWSRLLIVGHVTILVVSSSSTGGCCRS